jgi:hypothetical protein
MINEAKDVTFNAQQVIGLLEQAEIGCHALFDLKTIRNALDSVGIGESALKDSTVEVVQKAIVQLAGLDSVIEQRQFIKALPMVVQHLLVRLYFRFLDQFMQRRSVTLH